MTKLEAQVIQGQQFRGEKRPDGPFHGVVHSGLAHGLEEVVGVVEAHGVTVRNGSVSQGWARKVLPTPAVPTRKTCSYLQRNSRKTTASRSLRSRVMVADQTKSPNRQVSSKTALRSRSSRRHQARPFTSSERMIPKKEAQSKG